jgi:SAM-dependent methyltransferase
MAPPKSTQIGAWRGLSGEALALIGDAIIGVARELSRQMPIPRGAPFYGMEALDGDLTPLETFCSRGIFRKYEHALHVGCDLGGAARWWSAHFGCDVVGVETHPAAAALAQRLSVRAGVRQTRFVCGLPAAVPCRARFFTHVWSVERLGDLSGDDRRLRESLRLLRPGAHTALQVAAPQGAWTDRAAAALRDLGFIEVEAQVARRPAIPESWRVARERLLRHLDRLDDARGPESARRLGELYAATEGAADQVVQVFARRPAA